MGSTKSSILVRPTRFPFLKDFKKYQGVQEFHMLARVGYYYKVMDARPRNMAQNSNSLLSPITSMVVRGNQGQMVIHLITQINVDRGNQWQLRTNSDTSSKF